MADADIGGSVTPGAAVELGPVDVDRCRQDVRELAEVIVQAVLGDEVAG
jgi:hypothetical protein